MGGGSLVWLLLPLLLSLGLEYGTQPCWGWTSVSIVHRAPRWLGLRRPLWRLSVHPDDYVDHSDHDDDDDFSVSDWNPDDNDMNPPIWYNDFDDTWVGGQSSNDKDDKGSTSSSSSSSSSMAVWTAQLQQRIHQVQEQEAQVQAHIQHNWQRGNWHVRGVSLDTSNTVVPPDQEQEEPETDTTERRRIQGSGGRHPLLQSSPLDISQPPPESLWNSPPNALGVDVKSPSSGSSSDSISITAMALQSLDDDDDNSDRRLIWWLGRSNGSILALQWSDEEVWARFRMQLVPTTTTTPTTEPSWMVKPGLAKEPSPSEEDDDQNQNPTRVGHEGFQIMAQELSEPPSAPIQHVLPLKPQHQQDDDSSTGGVFVLSSTTTGSGTITVHHTPLPLLDPLQEPPTSYTFLQRHGEYRGVHSQPLVALAQVSLATSSSSDPTMTTRFICSVSRDGSVALWAVPDEPNNNNSDDNTNRNPLVARIQLHPPVSSMDDNDNDDPNNNKESPPRFHQHQPWTAAHVSPQRLHVGTHDGHVWIYQWADVVEKGLMVGNPQEPVTVSLYPVGSIHTSPDHHASVTAITEFIVEKNHDTTNNQNKNQNDSPATVYLAIGNDRGMVRHWQLLERTVTDEPAHEQQPRRIVEPWPKLQRKTLPGGVAHVFPHIRPGQRRRPPETKEDEEDDATAIVDVAYLVVPSRSSSTTSSSPTEKDATQRPSTKPPLLVLLTATQDSVCCWNTATGQEMHELLGFDHLTTICPVPAPRSAFCTTGMKHVACIHDYTNNNTDEEDDEDDFDVGDYLNFDE